MTPPLRITVIGTGHVGLVTSATLAAFGHQVVGVDKDREKIDELIQGGCPFHERGLPQLLQEQVKAGRLAFAHEPADAVPGSDVIFICVGTPARASGEANLVAIETAAREIAHHVDRRVVVVEKSTVPAGTSDRLRRTLLLERPDLHGRVEVVSNPEFLREGLAVQDSLQPDRILVGASSDWALAQMRSVYQVLLDQGTVLIQTDIATAELAKHACNAFLATKISYANALARLCDRIGADVVAVANVMGTDPRIGRAFLDAGLGYGGYCFPKDVQAFERLASQVGYAFPLLREVERINEDAISAAVEKIRDALWNLEDKKVALLGLSFKPETDDVRFSPALSLARRLIDEGVTVVGYDPQAMSAAKSDLPELQLAPGAYDAVEDAHCVVLCTEWDEFRSLDLNKVGERMTYRVLVDGRNVYDPITVTAAGFTYYGMGRAFAPVQADRIRAERGEE